MQRWKLPKSSCHQSKQPCSSRVHLLLRQCKGWLQQLGEAASVAEMSSLNDIPIQTKYKVEVRKCRICRKAAENEENTMFEVEKLLSEVYI